MLTDLIAANAAEATAILSTQGHANIWPTLEAKTVDHVKLATLAFILKGKKLEDDRVIAYMKSFEALGDETEDGPWLQRLPRDLIDDLANLEDDKIAEIADAWASTEEARLDQWNSRDTSAFLREFSAFAASARAQQKDVLLWVCLQRRLTPRSRRGPTANQPARLQVVLIILPAGGSPCRRPRLTSNVRRRKHHRSCTASQ